MEFTREIRRGGDGRGAMPASLVIALALACGIAGAQCVPAEPAGAAGVAVWCGIAGVAIMGVLAAIPAANAGRWACLAGAALCGGVSLGASTMQTGLPPAGREGVARLVGRVASAPRETAAGADVLAAYAHGTASLVFELAVEAVERADHTQPASGAVMVRVQELGALPPRGARVRATGWYRAPGHARNPGSRTPTGDGSLSVARLAQIEVIDGAAPTPAQHLRLAADATLDASMPAWSTPAWRALVKAMTTGVREPALAAPGAEFRMAGMSHILAISGFNVAVLVGVGAAIAAALGAGVPARACAALATSLLFLVVTEPEVSVLRAGLGAGVAAIAGLRGGRARGLGTLGAVAAITLALDPSSLYSAGFQLSYGVVLGLLTLANAPCERWRARACAMLTRIVGAHSRWHEGLALGVNWFTTACVSSVVAFTVSTPVALWHGGFVSTYAAPISVFTMPAAALVTIGGVAAIALGSVWAGAGMAAGAVACGCAGFLAWVARAAADWPGSCWWVGRPAAWWVAAALLAVCVLWVARRAWARRCAGGVLCVLAVLVWYGPARPYGEWPLPGQARVDALDVGDGACVLVRSHTHAVLYDAGTSSDDSAGSRRIVPALAALGVRRINAIVLSHDRLAHFSAVPEVVRAFGVQRVLLPGPALVSPSRPLRMLAEWLHARGIPVEAAHAGDDAIVGNITMRVLWPPVGAAFDARGDASLVVRMQAGDASAGAVPLFFCGGLGAEGCEGLLQSAMRAPQWFGPVTVLAWPRDRQRPESIERLVRHMRPRATIDGASARTQTCARRFDVRADADVRVYDWSGSGWRVREEERALEVHDIADR